MESLQIIGWTSYDSDYPNIDFAIYGQTIILGLFFQEIVEHNLCFSGEDHQNHPLGVPLFSNGCVLRMSMRAFAFIMSSIKNSDNGEAYLDFYMNVEDRVLPTEEGNIEPGEDTGALPVLLPADQQLILDSISADVDLLTTDKAILSMYPLYKQKYSNKKIN